MTSRERAMERLESPNSQWTIEKAQEAIARNQKSVEYLNSLPAWKIGYDTKLELSRMADEIEILTAMVKIMTEQAEVAVAAEAVHAVASLVKSYAKATVMRKVVAMAANKLHNLGYTLSDCFKRAWLLVKGAISYIFYTNTVYQPVERSTYHDSKTDREQSKED